MKYNFCNAIFIKSKYIMLYLVLIGRNNRLNYPKQDSKLRQIYHKVYPGLY